MVKRTRSHRLTNMKKTLAFLILFTCNAYAQPDALPTELGGITLGQECEGNPRPNTRESITKYKKGKFLIKCGDYISRVIEIIDLDVTDDLALIKLTLEERYGSDITGVPNRLWVWGHYPYGFDCAKLGVSRFLELHDRRQLLAPKSITLGIGDISLQCENEIAKNKKRKKFRSNELLQDLR